ncbi:tetratricopeptide repeat protein [Sphingomonas sp. HF-S3]|uniref:Tetratricopeptide repeat protein n=1 Tax=Sphingomonas rustica TaxID=3103142 RepID=A0ABV0B5M5_9SPHN
MARSNAAPLDSAILRYAIALKAGDRAGVDAALDRLAGGPLNFMAPVLRAWVAQDRGGDPFAPLAAASGPLGGRYAAEHRGLLLIHRGQVDEGLAVLQPLIEAPRSNDLRIDAAFLLGLSGRRDRARDLLLGDGAQAKALRDRLGRGTTRPGAALGSAWLFLSIAADLAGEQAPPEVSVLLTRSALLLEPGDDRLRLYLAEALSKLGMTDLALTVLAEVRRDSPFAQGAIVSRISVLDRAGREDEALVLAKVQAERRDAGWQDAATYGDLLSDEGQHAAAATAYRAAIDRGGADSWSLHYRRGVALDTAGDWPGAEAALRKAIELGPREAKPLSTLGSAMVRRGQQLAEAQTLLERANRLKPDDAAIIDSLGWAYFMAGDTVRALPLLEKAARGDPGGSLVNEHLGDVYWQLGRRVDARYAWNAASIYADSATVGRIAAKIENGPRALN